MGYRADGKVVAVIKRCSKQRIYVTLWYNSHIMDAKTTHPCIAGRLENKLKNDGERLLDSIIYANLPMQTIISGSRMKRLHAKGVASADTGCRVSCATKMTHATG